MRVLKMSLLSVFLLCQCLFIPLAHADYATLESLGNPNLVLEDETTKLSLFNLGNPAGLAFEPAQDRLDLTFQASRIVDVQEFTTGDIDVSTSQVEAIDYSVSGTYNSMTYTGQVVGSRFYYQYLYLSPDGTTLTANRVYSWKKSLVSGGLVNDGKSLYQGVRFSPVEKLSLQVIPLADWGTTFSSDVSQRPLDWQTGGWLRGAYHLLPDLALGAGIQGIQSRSESEDQDLWGLQTHAELGLAYRLHDLFDETDLMNLGVMLQAGQNNSSLDDATSDVDLESQPLLAGIHGVYTYHSVMDVGINVDYQYEDAYRILDGQELLDSALRALNYELQFRVRLPMVRDDDLRFGVSFNNEGIDHPYPTGTLQLLNADAAGLDPVIRTSSSGISIGAALVPYEGSIVGLQYNIGSSLSRQDGDENFLADSGYTNFTLATQFQIIKGLSLQASYVDKRVVYESKDYRTVFTSTTETRTYADNSTETITYLSPNPSYESVGLISEAVYTQTGNFGVTLADGPWKASLNFQYNRTSYTPAGWRTEEKPVDVFMVNKDKQDELSGMLSLSWMF